VSSLPPHRLVLVALLSVAVVGCASPAPPVAVATPQVASLATPTAVATPSATALPTLAATPSPRRVLFDFSVAARRVPIVLRLDEARLNGDALSLSVEFINAGARDLQGPTGASGNDAVLVADGAPQQPTDVTASLAADIAPSGRWNAGATNRGTLVFRQPQDETATLRLPGFPPVQIDLKAGSARAIADDGATLPTPTPNPASPALLGARDALTRLQQAILRQDRDAFARVTTPAAREFFRDVTDPLAFARNVPFSRLELEMFPIDPTAEQVVVVDGQAARLVNVPVALVYAFTGVENEWFRHVLTLDFERVGAEWRVANIRADRSPFWTVGLTAHTRSPHFLVFHRAGQNVEAVIAAAEKAHAMLGARLEDLVDPVNIMVIVDDRDLFTQVTQQSGHSFVGSARYDNLLTATGIRVASRALFINEGAFSNGNLVNRRDQTIQHELTHLALARWTRPWTPTWLVEGTAGLFADETNYDALDDFVRQQGVDAVSLDSVTGIETLDQAGVPLLVAYAYSTFVAETIVEQFGQDKFLDLYRAFADVSMDRVREAAGEGVSVAPDRFRNLQRTNLDELAPSMLGVTPAELTARVKMRLQERLARP